MQPSTDFTARILALQLASNASAVDTWANFESSSQAALSQMRDAAAALATALGEDTGWASSERSNSTDASRDE